MHGRRAAVLQVVPFKMHADRCGPRPLCTGLDDWSASYRRGDVTSMLPTQCSSTHCSCHRFDSGKSCSNERERDRRELKREGGRRGGEGGREERREEKRDSERAERGWGGSFLQVLYSSERPRRGRSGRSGTLASSLASLSTPGQDAGPRQGYPARLSRRPAARRQRRARPRSQSSAT